MAELRGTAPGPGSGGASTTADPADYTGKTALSGKRNRQGQDGALQNHEDQNRVDGLIVDPGSQNLGGPSFHLEEAHLLLFEAGIHFHSK